MPTPRFASTVAEVDGKLFVIGGSQSNQRLATVDVYDPATNSWTPRAAMPTARKNTAAAVVNGIIYVFGGALTTVGGSITTTEAYDPNTDVWTTKRAMPTARGGLAAFPVNGKIYAIGGFGTNAFAPVVEVYDPVTDTWENKAPLPVASGNFGFAAFNGKLYVFGGTTLQGPLSDTREYDPVTDSWTTKAAMPIARVYPWATVLDGKIYVLGGNVSQQGSFPATGRVDLYDPVTNTWEAGVPMPTARSGLVSATVKGKIYAIGGHTGVSFLEPGTIYANVEEFVLPAPALTSTRVNNQMQLTLTGKQGSRYAIETSTDLANWISPLTVTVTDPSGTITFPAPGEPGDPRRFYRPALE